mmetsp:Transcript_123329/g.226267  ORF Transcript_123329/g.226267 Transcript_123329/m.226267 type:complete len:212 (+) Transcript_123329:195-830(+)
MPLLISFTSRRFPPSRCRRTRPNFLSGGSRINVTERSECPLTSNCKLVCSFSKSNSCIGEPCIPFTEMIRSPTVTGLVVFRSFHSCTKPSSTALTTRVSPSSGSTASPNRPFSLFSKTTQQASAPSPTRPFPTLLGAARPSTSKVMFLKLPLVLSGPVCGGSEPFQLLVSSSFLAVSLHSEASSITSKGSSKAVRLPSSASSAGAVLKQFF